MTYTQAYAIVKKSGCAC